MYEYVIPLDDFCIKSPHGIYIVTAVMDVAKNEATQMVILNDNQLYCYRRQLMEQTCIPCSDKRNFKRLETMMYYEIMLKDSIRLGRVDDAMKYYGRILRIIGQTGCSECTISKCGVLSSGTSAMPNSCGCSSCNK